MIWQRSRDGLEVTKCIHKYAKNESFVGYGKAFTEAYGPRFRKAVTDTAEIVQVANHKLLGLIIDEDLTFEVNVDELCNKLWKRLGLLLPPYQPILEEKSENHLLLRSHKTIHDVCKLSMDIVQ